MVAKRLGAYIGVTGFTQKRDAECVLEMYDSLEHEPLRKLMIGVLASKKTLNGLPGKYPKRYPATKDIAAIFPDHPYAVNFIHFATDTPESLRDDLTRLTALGGPNFHGFQLNMAWPDPLGLAAYRKENPDKRVVLQVGSRALEKMGNDPKRVAEKIAEYADLIDDVLLDPSGGTGRELNANEAREYLHAIREKLPLLGLGAAGGLAAHKLHLVAPLLREFPHLSIDAESRLRNVLDELDSPNAMHYFKLAHEMLVNYVR